MKVGLANILESIVETLKDMYEVSYLFLKLMSKEKAPDYLNIIKHPMDLSTIKEKVRRLEYKSREQFRHDIWQIIYNAHKYNNGRNPGIPPLVDQLLKPCDYLLNENDAGLTEAEADIKYRDTYGENVVKLRSFFSNPNPIARFAGASHVFSIAGCKATGDGIGFSWLYVKFLLLQRIVASSFVHFEFICEIKA